jgi:predicted RNA binding protein YcfA (HicA-like mRNA interferase family)
VNSKQVIRKLRALGVEVVPGRGKGGHLVLQYKGAQTVIAVHSKDMPPHHIKTICKQLGIDPALI